MQSVKKYLLLSLLAAISLPAAARDWDAIKSSGTLQLATEGAYPPFNFFQGAKLSGYEVDVAEAIAAKMGLKIEWKALSFDAMIPAIRQDRFDAGIASHGITEERQKSVEFANPHYCSGGQIVSKTGGPKTTADLAGKTVVVQLATTYADAAKKITGIKEIKTLPKDTDAQQAIINGRADAWITDRFVAKGAVEKNAAAGLQRGDMVFTERDAMIMKKGNTGLRNAVNQALEDLKKDGSIVKISQKWFSEDITCK